MSQFHVHADYLQYHSVYWPHETCQNQFNPILEEMAEGVKQWSEEFTLLLMLHSGCCPWLEKCEKLQFHLIFRYQASVIVFALLPKED